MSYIDINSKNDFCKSILRYTNDNVTFRAYNNGGFRGGGGSSKYRVFIPGHSVLTAMDFARGHGSTQVKIALCLGREPGDFSSSHSSFTNVYPPNSHFFNINDLRSPKILKVGGTGSESYSIFYIYHGPGSDTYLYVNIFSGFNDVLTTAHLATVPRVHTVSWCGSSAGDEQPGGETTIGEATLSPGSGTQFNRSPQNLTINCPGAHTIKVSHTICSSATTCEPTEPADPSSSHSGAIELSNTEKIKIEGTPGEFTKHKFKLAGRAYNSASRTYITGPVSDVFEYAIDLRPGATPGPEPEPGPSPRPTKGLTVYIRPEEAIAAGAKWRVLGNALG